ncbi:MAG: peptidoglycan-binding protein, partial [Clostridia bacterium]|nr:peptidoglycan-binding protein [Clostridia bacterium]
MKKLKYALLLILLLCLLPVCTALAKTGRVTASSLNMRKSASSDSKVVGTLREGDKVTIKDSKGSWYKVSKGSKTGYVYKKYIDVSGSGSSGSKSSGSKKSSKSSGSSDGTCGPGDSGSAVKKVQQRLKKLGYYTGTPDGDYGGGTKTAVKNFQKRNGLKATGTVNKKTLSKLNSSKAKKAKASDAAGSDSAKGAGSTERLNWFNGGSSKIPKGATFQVKDIKTGIVFTVKRWSGANHIDAEPKTASDTKKMKKIFGHWSWRRRPVLVKYNGHVYAGSM